MLSVIKIPLRIPNDQRPNRYFSFRLQNCLRNENCIYKIPPTLFVISSINGNFDTFYHLLIKHGIIDRHFGWKFGEGHLIVLGDCFNETTLTTECLWFIYSLEQKAKLAGGYVHFILGPHEITHINGEWGNTHPPYALSTSRTSSPFTALYDGNQELRRWLGTKNVVEQIGHLLFVTGELLCILSKTEYSFTDINTVTRSLFKHQPKITIYELCNALLSGNKIVAENLNSHQKAVTEEQVDLILLKFEVNAIVTSCCEQERIYSLFQDKMIDICVNQTKNNSQGLLLRRGIFYRADLQGKKDRIH